MAIENVISRDMDEGNFPELGRRSEISRAVAIDPERA